MFKIPRDKCSSALKKNTFKIAFTLAEVMIVLTIIGILSAILLPSAIHSTPDKNILKFKKAHNTLFSAVRELATSGQYYMPGFLGLAPDGNWPDGTSLDSVSFHSASYAFSSAMFPDIYNAGASISYFCNSFSDVISYKSKNCSYSSITEINTSIFLVSLAEKCVTDFSGFQNSLDTVCQTYNSTDSNYLQTQDDVYFHEAPWILFGRISADSCESNSNFLAKKDEFGEDTCYDKNGFDIAYHPYCLDIDGFDGPIKPFGYGIRSDGKIVSGARADWWLSRDITKKETDCCPKDLNTNGLCDEGDTVCE